MVPGPAPLDATKFLRGDATFAQIPQAYAYAYHASDSSFPRTNSTLGIPSADNSSTFTTVESNGLTISSALSGSDKLPGIIVTPTRSGRYLIKAKGGCLVSGSAPDAAIGLYDGSAIVDVCVFRGGASAGANAQMPYHLEHIAVLTAATPKTFSIYTGASSGAMTLQTTYTGQDKCINWLVEWIGE